MASALSFSGQVSASPSRSDEPDLGAASAATSSARARAGLRVAVIGGLTRATHEWERAGQALGVRLEHHDGRTAGGRAETLAAIVRRAELVITLTVPNSHGAVTIARRVANHHGNAFVLVERLRPSGLAAVIDDALAGASPRRGAR